MFTGSGVKGRGESGEMVCTPVPGMSKVILSTTEGLLLALVSRMACLSEPAPESLVLVTRKVVSAWAGGATSPATSGGTTRAAAKTVAARATLALRAAELRSLSAFDVDAVYVISC